MILSGPWQETHGQIRLRRGGASGRSGPIQAIEGQAVDTTLCRAQRDSISWLRGQWAPAVQGRALGKRAGRPTRFLINRVGSWIHLDLDGARPTSAFIGPALDLQEFTVSVDRPELSAKLHAIAQGLVTLPWLILGG